ASDQTSPDWAVRQWRIAERDPRGGWILGFAGLGRHAGRWFHILARYPGEYADGFGPRAERILEHWRWADGAPLAPPRSPGASSAASRAPDAEVTPIPAGPLGLNE